MARRVIGLGVGLLMAVGLAVASAGSAVAAKSSKPSESTLRIAMVAAFTGAADGDPGNPTQHIAEAWEKWVNSQGGINGHPVQIIFANTNNDNATATRVATNIVQHDHVIAEVGGFDSVSGPIWDDIFTKAHIPVIGGENIDPTVIRGSDYFFDLATDGLALIDAEVKPAKLVGAKSYALVNCALSTGCSVAESLEKAYVQKLGLSWNGEVGISPGQPSYTAACLTMQGTNAQYLDLGVQHVVNEQFVNSCLTQHITFKYYGMTSGSYDNPTEMKLSKQGTVVYSDDGFPWWPNTPAIKNYRDVVAKYAGKNTNIYGSHQTGAWAALEMFRSVMQEVGAKPTPAYVADQMWKVKNDTLGGLLPQPVTFTKGKHSTPINCFWWGTLKNEKWSQAKTTCVPDAYNLKSS